MPAGTFICVLIDDYLIGEARMVNGCALGTSDGSTTTYTNAEASIMAYPGEEAVYVDGVVQGRGTDYNCDYTTGALTFTTAPGPGAVLSCDCTMSAYTPARLWRVNYIDTNPGPSLNVGMVKNLDYMYGYPNGASEQLLTGYA